MNLLCILPPPQKISTLHVSQDRDISSWVCKKGCRSTSKGVSSVFADIRELQKRGNFLGKFSIRICLVFANFFIVSEKKPCGGTFFGRRFISFYRNVRNSPSIVRNRGLWLLVYGTTMLMMTPPKVTSLTLTFTISQFRSAPHTPKIIATCNYKNFIDTFWFKIIIYFTFFKM